MSIQITDMGLQPKAEVSLDGQTATGDMVPTTQWDFDGKDVGEAFHMLDDTAEHDEERSVLAREQVGLQTFTNADGTPFVDLASREDLFRGQPGYLRARVRAGITVPSLPWQKDRLPGERYADYIRRTRGAAAKE